MSRSPDSPSVEPRLLDLIAYPTDRGELLQRARRIDAPDAIRDAIRRLRPGLFRSHCELVEAIESLI